MGGWFDYLRFLLGWKSGQTAAPIDTAGRTYQRLTVQPGITCQITANAGYSAELRNQPGYTANISGDP